MRTPGPRPVALLLAALLVVGSLATSPAGASDPPRDDGRLRSAAPASRRIVTGSAPERARADTVPSSERSGRGTFDPLAPVTSLSFDAIPRTGGNWPGDPTGAVSDTWYLTAVNTHYALYDLAGAAVLGPTSFAGLFDLPSGTQVFDPKVVYDPYGDTFVLAFLGVNDPRRRSWILVVAIPDQTAEDPSTWCSTRVGGDRTSGDGRQWADYPGLGFSSDRVTLTSNQFDFSGGGFAAAQILSFPKDNLYDCSTGVEFDTFVGSDTLDPDGSQAFTIQPAVSVGPAPSSQFLVSLDEGSPSELVVWRLKPGTTGLRLARTALPIGNVAIPPFGTQCGGSLHRADTWWDPGDLRLVTAFYDAERSRLYTAHSVAKDLTPDPVTGNYVESVIRWYDLRIGSELGSSDVVRKGLIGEPETDAGWPAIATDEAGNAFIVYSRASQPADECLSAWAAEVLSGGSAATVLELVPGEARFEAIKGPERWGDFGAAVRDPVDGTRVVLIDQYAEADGGASTMDWQQVVHVVSVG